MILKRRNSLRVTAAIVLLAMITTLFPAFSMKASAAQAGTSLHFAEHGIKAYNEEWIYVYGAKGQVIDGHRASDCAGLLYAYFTDNGMSPPPGGATSQVDTCCVFSGDLYEGLPRIHGLVLTVPDYYDPGTGIYGHIGIYVGNGYATDNSSPGVNMRYQLVADNGSWNAWHIFDNGLKYAKNGWYAFNGYMYHYTNYQYDINTHVDGYMIGSDGIARTEDGTPIPVDASMKNDGYVSASTVASYLKSQGYDGEDDTYDLIFGGGSSGGETDGEYNGIVTGSGVNLRSAPSTSASVVTNMAQGTKLNILEEKRGEAVSNNGQISAVWYHVKTATGFEGYVSAWFAKVIEDSEGGNSGESGSEGSGEDNPGGGEGTGEAPAAPVISAKNGYVTLRTDTADADIYYTTDGTEPTADSTPYTDPVYMTCVTYKTIAVKEGVSSPVTVGTVLSDNSIFTDLNVEAWYFPMVDEAVSKGIFSGLGEQTFSPNTTITRAQFVQALANMDGVDLSAYEGYSSFNDIPASSWSAKAVNWASSMGIVNGYSDGSFHPNDKITREQMCVILVNYGGLTKSDNSQQFADDASIAGWAKEAVYACRDNGLVSGKSGNIFDPKGNTKRCEAAKVMVSYTNL